MTYYASLCELCRYGKKVVSGKGSHFLMCQLSVSNKQFPKYPPQPLFRCSGFEQNADKGKSHDS